jgi:hypothetical protein
MVSPIRFFLNYLFFSYLGYNQYEDGGSKISAGQHRGIIPTGRIAISTSRTFAPRWFSLLRLGAFLLFVDSNFPAPGVCGKGAALSRETSAKPQCHSIHKVRPDHKLPLAATQAANLSALATNVADPDVYDAPGVRESFPARACKYMVT